MTPRSRKPVMLTGALLGVCGEQQASTSNGAANSFCSFREQDEDEHCDAFDAADTADQANDETAGGSLGHRYTSGSPFGSSTTLFKSKSEGDFSVLLPMDGHARQADESGASKTAHTGGPESLTSPFK